MRGGDIIKNKKSVQDWLPFDKVLDNGVIQCKDSYVKIVKVLPINYDLKSNLEKKSILNSYKLFLKTCDFNIQIIVQSKREDISKHFLNLKKISEKEENSKIKAITQDYINFLKIKNEENKSSSKNFYIIFKYDINLNKETDENLVQSLALNYLNECFFKIKDSLSRCGNTVYDINSRIETEKILNSFFNPNVKSKNIEIEE